MTYNINLSSSIYPTKIIKETILELEKYLESIALEEKNNNLLISSQKSTDINEFMNYLLDKVSTKELN